jgi:microsomal dipeptidase-like Zn-dependent dipeptidase
METNKMKKKPMDINKIIKNNPNIDTGQLQRNLHMLNELKRAGVKVGPNYNLESPFSRSIPEDKKY